jgi:phosphonate transport system substrate-binding protein
MTPDMKLRLLVAVCGFAVSILSSGLTFSQEKARQPERVRLGGVAYAPKMVTVFRNLTTYLNGKVDIVSLKGETDAKGNRADKAEHILKTLEDGRGDAAIVLEGVWNKATKFRKSNPNIATVWTSPEFSHCTFTAPGSFDKQLGSQFTRLMTKMGPSDPIVAELLRLEDAQRFVPSDSKGFGALYQALGEKKK